MPNLNKEQVMAELTNLGVQYDPELGFNELRTLLKGAKAKAGETDTDNEDDSGSEEGKKPEQGKAPVNPRLPKAPTELEESAETRTINTNVKHNGTLYAKGTQVSVTDDNFAGLESGGFFEPVK